MSAAMPIAATGFQRPRPLPPLAPQPPLDMERDVTVAEAPDNIASGSLLDVRSTYPLDEFGPSSDLFAGKSHYDDAWRVNRPGMGAAVAAAQQLASGHEALAVVQDAEAGARYIVPLGVWDPRDESQLAFEDIGGTPHWHGADSHVLLRPTGRADVEAIVFDGGRSWINTTGHPVRLPVAQAAPAG